MAGDLHTHTTWSDGSNPARLLPGMAARIGLTHLAISDHDSLRSVRYAWEHPEQEGVSLIPATELTAYDFERGRRVHILCYWPQDCAALRDFCDTMARRRLACGLETARLLEERFPQFRTEMVLEHAKDSGILFKAHAMRALMDIGAADQIYGALYRELFGTRHAPGPVARNPEYESVDAVLEVIRQSCGVAVLAHPSVYRSMELAAQLAAEGRIDGVEIDHPRNTPEDRAELHRLADRYGLIVTGGTDYHGMNSRQPRPLGTCTTADVQIERIRALAQARSQAAL